MKLVEYKVWDRYVENKMSSREWFTCSWSQEYEVCQDKVNSGVLENRWNEEKNKVEFKAL
jgi:hypothetical protein